MTVDNFLYETYLGKKISFVVRERKRDNEVYEKVVSPIQERKLFYSEWEERKDGWFRDVEYIDMVIEIKQRYNYWNIKTMLGFVVRLYPDKELNIVV